MGDHAQKPIFKPYHPMGDIMEACRGKPFFVYQVQHTGNAYMLKNQNSKRSATRQCNSIAEKKRKWIKLADQLNGYSYDTTGRLLVQSMPNGDTVTYQLDQNGNRTQLIWPDDYYAEYVFDELNRLTDIKLNGATTSSVSFEYDVLSRRTLTAYANSCTCVYEYALNNDLTHQNFAFVGSAVNFKYFYNRVHQIIGLIPDDFSYFWTPSSSATYSYDTANNLNQYPAVDSTSFAYNGNGCLTGGPLSATFDVLNRVTQIVSGGTTSNYWVDPLNRQAQKSVNGTKTQYLYDGNQIIADYDGSDTLQNRYIRAGLDEALIQIAGSTLTYNHMDRQGSTIAQTDASGAVLNKYTYSPFGETASLSGTIFGYTGQRYDSEVGLYNYKARYYDPAIGRFLQPDPIGYAGGLNLYCYVGNNATNLVDPLGLEAGLVGGPLPGLAQVILASVNAIPQGPGITSYAPQANSPTAVPQGPGVNYFPGNVTPPAPPQNQQQGTFYIPGSNGGPSQAPSINLVPDAPERELDNPIPRGRIGGQPEPLPYLFMPLFVPSGSGYPVMLFVPPSGAPTLVVPIEIPEPPSVIPIPNYSFGQ